MKRETFRHPKILDLAARLQCTRPEAIGYLTLLWDFTAEYAIQGDIGKHANGAITRACDYQGDPEKFIQALVDSRWLDADPDYRLLVHDWAEHCERWVKLKIQKIGKSFIKPLTERSIEASTEEPVIDITEASPSCDQSNPNQSKPTGGASAPTLWDVWLGIPGVGREDHARSHLGKLIKQYGEAAVAAAVAVVAVKKPAEPNAFLEGQLKANPKSGKREEWALIPREDEKLWPWAKQHGYSNPGSLDYFQYRRKLQQEVEIRLNQ